MRRVAEEKLVRARRPCAGARARGARRTLRTGAPLLAAAALFLASCATVPQRSTSAWLGVLPSDATLYASLSVPGSAALIKKALQDAGPGLQDISTLLDMTKRMVCSVTLQPGTAARFSAAALGSYPSGIIAARLGGNKEWTRTSSASGTWWQWSKAGIQMSIPNNGILLASNGGVEPLLSRWASPPALRVPPDVADDMESGDLVVYMPELPGGMNQNAAQNNMRIPIHEVWLKALKGKDGYDVTGTANTGTERDARVVTLALKIGIVAWLRSEQVPDVAERLKTITVSASGVQVKMAGLHVTEAEVVPMFLSLVKGLAPAAPQEDSPEPSPAPAPDQGSPASAGDSG